MSNWTEISAPALTHNFHTLQKTAGPATEILAVIKANAYGHGAALCAPILVRAGARWLGVTSATEGALVRQTLTAEGLEADILIMSGFLPEDVPLIAAHNLTPAVWTLDQIAALAPATRIHVEVDTGMGRQGVPPGPPLDDLLARIATSSLRLDGLFTHFCSSEEANSPLTQLQQSHFASAVAQVHTHNHKPKSLHAGNTSTLDNPAQPTRWLEDLAATIGARAMIRAGLALYGYALPISNRSSEGDAQPHLRPALQPVMTWRAHILSTRTLAHGDTVGYNATFTATRPTRIATLSAGYAEGLRRELSGKPDGTGGWVIILDQPCPILGRISMNLTVVDITHLPPIPPHTTATLLGPGITAADHAALAHTIPYEILCGIHPSGLKHAKRP